MKYQTVSNINVLVTSNHCRWSPTIADERGRENNSKFLVTYKKTLTEYDDDLLARANDDVFDFGAFLPVNSTFIVGMPPNPGDTTNALLPRLIQITVYRSNFAPDISNLSSSTGYSSATAWMQTLAYASLAFSVLVAFGVVKGKQWLDSYKAA
ncbi:hypothetical protein EV702DRAFT_1195876 [Suillus placidus]|uniref:DUF6535 domain-containing protein n=1 Tax=Suillus placidus TaxID=48579 RepID=A0A9P6ZZT9_9AGAM|nr:hypothetical protein EV702DRAFT_1195876 [Suillus placidus]